MQVARNTVVQVTLSEDEAAVIAFALSDALWGLQLPQADGLPFNWKGDPAVLKALHNQIKPADWGEL